MLRITLIQGTPEMFSAALALAKAEKDYETAWGQYFHAFGDENALVKPLGKSRFWEMLAQFTREIECFYFGYKRTNGIEDAADELFRKAVTGESQHPIGHGLVVQYTYEDVLRFAVTYGCVKGHIEKRIGHLFEFAGDSFADLVDSLPLAGREFYAKKFHSQAALYEAGHKHLTDKWRKLIFGGENYIESTLEKAAKKWYLTLAHGEA